MSICRTITPCFLVALLLVACGPGCSDGLRVGRGSAQDWVKSELYFGLSSKSGEVTDREFQGFLDESVTPRFPAGFTVMNASGRWMDEDTHRSRSEPSRLLVILRPPGEPADGKIEMIRSEYRNRFDQQSVLRTDQKARTRF